jgi:plastocyanin
MSCCSSAAGAARALLLSVVAAGCAGSPTPSAGSGRYQPRTREVTITAVPLLTRELRRVYPFLVRDFASGGVLEGKEVYAFEPASITAVEGDTLALTLVNPEDDAHSFLLPGLAVGMPPQSAVTARYVAAHAGIYRYLCSVPTHLPFMYGTLVVLPAADFGAR